MGKWKREMGRLRWEERLILGAHVKDVRKREGREGDLLKVTPLRREQSNGRRTSLR